jgi:hypothetical protein
MLSLSRSGDSCVLRLRDFLFLFTFYAKISVAGRFVDWYYVTAKLPTATLVLFDLNVMLRSGFHKLATALLIANFAIGSAVPLDQAVSAQACIFDALLWGDSFHEPGNLPDDESCPSAPTDSTPTDCCDATSDALIFHSPRKGLAIDLRPHAFHPVEPALLYSLHASDDLLRPPRC